MNLVEIQKLQKIDSLLEKILEGKVEYLQETKKAKELTEELIEFKDIDMKNTWKYAQE